MITVYRQHITVYRQYITVYRQNWNYGLVKLIFKFKWTELRETDIETGTNLRRGEKKKNKKRKFNNKKKIWCNGSGTNPARSWWCRRKSLHIAFCCISCCGLLKGDTLGGRGGKLHTKEFHDWVRRTGLAEYEIDTLKLSRPM